jgi:hypothetical protein
MNVHFLKQPEPPQPEATAKPWYKSWTVRFNVLALLTIALDLLGDPVMSAFLARFVSTEQLLMLTSIVNILLRVYKTKGPVS